MGIVRCMGDILGLLDLCTELYIKNKRVSIDCAPSIDMYIHNIIRTLCMFKDRNM